MSWLSEIGSDPDWQTMTIRREGELLVAKVRLWIASGAVLIALLSFERGEVEPWIGLACALSLIGISLAIRSLAARPEPPPLLGFFTAILDVSIVSAGNAAFILSGQPLAATSGRVYFSIYLLALAFTSIRQDVRLCIVAGVTAVAQYAVLVFWALPMIDLSKATSYGAFRWDNQIARMAILAFATVIHVVTVRRGRLFMTAALQDVLTGLANRRYAEARLQEAVAIARRSKRPLVVAVGDLDAFKTVNDRYGHAGGDDVLRETGHRLREFCRATDMVARYGGEEFLIVMFDADVDGALHRLQEFQDAFAAEPIALRNGATVHITMSIGVSSCPADATNVADLIAIADARMYSAKSVRRGPTLHWPKSVAAS